jgi:hypothetical protein
MISEHILLLTKTCEMAAVTAAPGLPQPLCFQQE